MPVRLCRPLLVALVLCLLHGCGAGETATPSDTTRQTAPATTRQPEPTKPDVPTKRISN